MTGAEFCAWRVRMRYRQEDASAALECSIRMIRHWEHSDWPIPRMVELACRQIEREASQEPGGYGE